MKVKTKTFRHDRGWSRVVYVDGKLIGSIGFSFHPSNSGALFARNYGKGPARVTTRLTNDADTFRTEIAEARKDFRFMREAEKWGRAVIHNDQLVDAIVRGSKN